MDLSNITLSSGKGDGKNTACLMSARSLLDGRPFGDDHPSAVLRRIGIRINDGNWWESDEERTRVLLPVALDERLCASKCDASRAAEIKRAKSCAHWALSFAAPLALDCAADALRKRWPDSAALLSGHADTLRREPTVAMARMAQSDANKARSADAADAHAAYDAAADDAAAADAAAYAAYDAAYDAADAAAYAAAYAAYDAADAAYAHAAYDAADAAVAAAAYAHAAAGAKRIEIRDSLMALFDQLLDVRA